MKRSKYYILGLLGSLLSFYYGLLVLGLESQYGVLLVSAGLFMLAGLVILWGFPRSRDLCAAIFLIAAASNLVVVNSIFSSILPALLGILLIAERNKHV